MENVSAKQHHVSFVETLLAALVTWRDHEELTAARHVKEAAVQQQIDRAFAEARPLMPRELLADS